MGSPSSNEAPLDKQKKCTAREKAEKITAFLTECGEHSTWEEWQAFLHKHQVNGFEWTQSVD